MHLSDDEIEQLLAARLEPARQQSVVQHLLAGCGLCSRRLIERTPDRLLDETSERRPQTSRHPLRHHAIAMARRQEARWRTEEGALDRSLELLRARPQDDGLIFRQSQPLHGKSLVEALLQQSWDARFRDPKSMRWLAYNALKAAESLRPGELLPAITFDLQARAWAELANAYRVNEEYVEADGAFTRAHRLLRQGSGDRHLLCLIALREATFKGSQRRMIEAHELADKAYQLALRLGDRHLAGQILLNKGPLSVSEGNPAQGAHLFRRGLALMDPDRDPQFVAAGHQGLIGALARCGQYQEAGRLLLKSDLRRRLAAPNVRWVEGQILAGLGHITKAENALMTVRDEFLSRGLSEAAAHVALDLLPLLLRRGKHGETRRIAKESHDILRNVGHHSCAGKARAYLQ
jgi:tetratricopeptide (TPR) repeat protein